MFQSSPTAAINPAMGVHKPIRQQESANGCDHMRQQLKGGSESRQTCDAEVDEWDCSAKTQQEKT